MKARSELLDYLFDHRRLAATFERELATDRDSSSILEIQRSHYRLSQAILFIIVLIMTPLH